MLVTASGDDPQFRQSNFGSYSTVHAQLREDVTYDTTREIIGAYCAPRKGDAKGWFVKVPDLKAVKNSSLEYSPSVTCVPEEGPDLPECMLEPTNPVTCLSDLMDSENWHHKHMSQECLHGGPGSVGFLTFGFKMHSLPRFSQCPMGLVLSLVESLPEVSMMGRAGIPCCSCCPLSRFQTLCLLMKRS